MSESESFGIPRPRLRVIGVTIPLSEYESLLISAVRYALGRMTYIVDDTVGYVERAWGVLSPMARHVITKDVGEAFRRNDTGMDCDTERWRALLELFDWNPD